VKKNLFPFYFGLLLLVSLYIGLAARTTARFHHEKDLLLKSQDSLMKEELPHAVTIDKISVKTQFEISYARLNIDYDERMLRLPDMDMDDALLLLSVSWGCIGGLIRLLFDRLYGKTSRRKFAPYLIPLLSAITGLVTYCITYYTPALIFKHEINYEPGYFIYAALIGGIFTKNLYDRLQSTI